MHVGGYAIADLEETPIKGTRVTFADGDVGFNLYNLDGDEFEILQTGLEIYLRWIRSELEPYGEGARDILDEDGHPLVEVTGPALYIRVKTLREDLCNVAGYDMTSSTNEELAEELSDE
jgi:hypothetical protein